VKEPLTSILIPCHNSERWIKPAIDSALAQTWRNIEVIIVDDGSSDQSLALLKTLESPRLKVIATTQRGASAARNTALRESQGDFIQYLDADDLLAPEKIAAQLNIIDSDDALLTFGSVIHFQDEQPPDQGVFSAATIRDSLRNPIEFLIDLLGGNGRGWMVQTGQWLVPRKISDQTGPWNESLSVDDDGEYFCRAILSAQKLAACPASVCFYRKHSRGGNLSARSGYSRRGAASLLASTRLKGRWLGQVSSDPRIATALAASYSSLALSSYPQAAEVSAEAITELHALGRELSLTGGTRWFDALTRIGGWKFARRMQRLAAIVRSKQPTFL